MGGADRGEPVLLYYFNNLTVEEIAELMECPAGTVKYRLSVSRSKIKKGVEAYEHKTHDKLYSFAGVPFLALLLSEEAKACEVPELTEQIMGAVRELGAGTQAAGVGAAADGAGVQAAGVSKDAGNAVGAATAVIHNNQQSKEETAISADAENSQGGQASGGESAAAGQSAANDRSGRSGKQV